MGTRYFRQARGAPKPWYRSDGGSRLETDRAIAAAVVPTLLFRIDEARERVFLEGDLVFTAECDIPTTVGVRIEFPWHYPQSEPIAFDRDQRFHKLPDKELIDRHLLRDGQCCLWLPPKTRWSQAKPDALRDFLLEVLVFFDRQLIYDVTESWPGPAYDHGWRGYREFIMEEFGCEVNVTRKLFPSIIKRQSVGRNEPCPCGSGSKYKRCHLSLVECIQDRIGTGQLLWMFQRIDLSQI